MLKRDFRKLMETDEDTIRAFCLALTIYQGANVKHRIRAAFDALPQDLKDAIKPSKRRLNSLYRGDDGKSDEPAISWTGSLSYARWFGYYVYPFEAVKSFEAAIDTNKLVKLISGITALQEYGIGDDEDEVILMGVTWRSDKDNEHIFSSKDT